MIDDAAELDAIFNNADKNADSSTKGYVLRSAYITKYGTITKGVYMLANDIDCKGSKADRTFDDKHYLAPIPSGQIGLNPNLGQNPGW